jgi:RNA polymerase sigma factor (sigma-70 family)
MEFLSPFLCQWTLVSKIGELAMSNTVSTSDAHLLELCLDGDQSAFGHVVARYQSLICSITYSVCGDLGRSEDLAQETFVTAWRKLTDLQDLAKFKPWISAIARNLAKGTQRKKSGQLNRDATDLNDALDATDIADSPSEAAIREEEAALVWETLEQIPENYREPMILFYREEHSVARVADAMELSEDAVKQRLSRGRKMLHGRLAALIETTLGSSAPTRAFTTSVIAAVATISPSPVHAAGIGTVGSKVVAGSGLSLGLGLFFLKLPLIAWAIKLQLDSARSEAERRLTLQLFGRLALFFAIFVGALLVVPQWIQLPASAQAFLPGGLMALFMIPVILLCRRLSNTVKALRASNDRERVAAEPRAFGPVYAQFAGGLSLVLIWPAVFLAVTEAYEALVLLFALLVLVPSAAAGLHRKFSAAYFQLFGANIAIPALLSIPLILSHSAPSPIAPPAVPPAISVDMLVMQGMVITQFVLMLIVWKRIYGKGRGRP